MYISGLHFALCSYGYDIYLSGGTSNPKTLVKFDSHRNEWITSPGNYPDSLVTLDTTFYIQTITFKNRQTCWLHYQLHVNGLDMLPKGI